MKRTLITLVGLGCIGVAVAVAMSRASRHEFTFSGPTPPATPVVHPPEATETQPARTDDWPQWRGPNRDARSPAVGLLTDWPDGGPPLVWKVDGLGRGMSSVSVADGRILTLGKRDGRGVCLIALNAQDGSEIWSTPIDNGGEPNGSPTIDGGRVFAITYDGSLVCADVQSGRLVWTKSLVKDFGGRVPQWGYSESPLIDGDVVVCTPGANRALIVALDKATGQTRWATSAPSEMQRRGHDGAGYSSIVVGHGAGIRQYVQLVGRGVLGVAATDGVPLWGYDRIANGVANIPTPIVHGDYVFVASGYGAGAALLRLQRSPRGVSVDEVYFHPGTKMQNHHGGMVLVDGHVYFGHGQNQGLPMCVELLTGRVAWGPNRGPGTDSAAVIYADGHLYFRYQNAVMALIEATPQAYRLKSSFQLPSHLDNSWPHPAIANGRLYLRDQDALLCYDVQAKP